MTIKNNSRDLCSSKIGDIENQRCMQKFPFPLVSVTKYKLGKFIFNLLRYYPIDDLLLKLKIDISVILRVEIENIIWYLLNFRKKFEISVQNYILAQKRSNLFCYAQVRELVDKSSGID